VSLQKKISYEDYENICYALFLRLLPMHSFNVFLDICKTTDRYDYLLEYSYIKGEVENE